MRSLFGLQLQLQPQLRLLTLNRGRTVKGVRRYSGTQLAGAPIVKYSLARFVSGIKIKLFI